MATPALCAKKRALRNSRQVFISEAAFSLIILLGVTLWGIAVILAHPAHAIVSWDEGFHGGAALFVTQVLRHHFDFYPYTYILSDFINGVIWYPPLWLIVSGILGALEGPSVEVYRFSTLLFGVTTLVLVAFFSRSIGGKKAGFFAALVLAVNPVFIIYSHLMMREVPLLFGVSLALLFYFRYLIRPKVNRFDLVVTTLAFAVAALSKIMAVAIIPATITIFGIFLFTFYRATLVWQRFYSRPTAFFLGAMLISFLSYRYLVLKTLNADMIQFFLGQSSSLGGEKNLLILTLHNFISGWDYYLQIFSQMPLFSLVWLVSLASLVIFQRKPISFYLLIWVIVTYLAFTVVRPLAYQYIMSIYAPLSVATGLLWAGWLDKKVSVRRSLIFCLVFVAAIILGLSSFDKTASIIWWKTITNQDQVAAEVVQNAHEGDRVVVSGDGNIFLLHLLGESKKIQTINGAAKVCSQTLEDSAEWAIADFGPQDPIGLTKFDLTTWQKFAGNSNDTGATTIYHNPEAGNKVMLTGSKLDTLTCSRLLRPGKNKITFWATANMKNGGLANSPAVLSLRTKIFKPLAETVVGPAAINNSLGKQRSYSMIFNQQKIDQPAFFLFFPPQGVNLDVEKIEIDYLGNK